MTRHDYQSKPYSYSARRQVQFVETDAAGIVHFSNYFRYMESVEHEFFRSLGHSIHMRLDGREVTFPRVNAACDFRRPLRFEQEFEVRLLVRAMRSRSLVFDVLFVQGGQAVARGSLTTVCITRENGEMRATDIPPQIRDTIQPAPAEALAELDALYPLRKDNPNP